MSALAKFGGVADAKAWRTMAIILATLNQVGIMAYPLDFMSPKLPGLGDVDWGKYVSALTDIGYDGYTCIEVEDMLLFTGHLWTVII